MARKRAAELTTLTAGLRRAFRFFSVESRLCLCVCTGDTIIWTEVGAQRTDRRTAPKRSSLKQRPKHYYWGVSHAICNSSTAAAPFGHKIMTGFLVGLCKWRTTVLYPTYICSFGQYFWLKDSNHGTARRVKDTVEPSIIFGRVGSLPQYTNYMKME